MSNYLFIYTKSTDKQMHYKDEQLIVQLLFYVLELVVRIQLKDTITN
jgi:hypothetical protein